MSGHTKWVDEVTFDPSGCKTEFLKQVSDLGIVVKSMKPNGKGGYLYKCKRSDTPDPDNFMVFYMTFGEQVVDVKR